MSDTCGYRKPHLCFSAPCFLWGKYPGKLASRIRYTSLGVLKPLLVLLPAPIEPMPGTNHHRTNFSLFTSAGRTDDDLIGFHSSAEPGAGLVDNANQAACARD